MHHFQYKKDTLFCEDVSIIEIAERAGTPFYLYSSATLERHFKVFDNAFKKIPHIVCYSVKANSNLSVLKLFSMLGGGADIVSGGELFRSLKAGIDPSKIVYSGVGKSIEEIRFALDSNILMFNVESPQELDLINEIAGKMRKKASVAIRVNPDVDPNTHPYISTGLKRNKFGINIKKSLSEYKKAAALKNVEIIGIDCHIGSQLTEVSPFIAAIKKIKSLLNTLREKGFNIRYLDIGGGLGITYSDEEPPHPDNYAEAVIKEVKDLKVTLILEPGRVLVGNAGVLVTKVLYTKEGDEKSFIVVDAGMNDLARPSLYDSYHGILPIVQKVSAIHTADVVGPICESGDFLAKERPLPEFKQGDLMAVMSAGAYGYTMSSNYNSRLRVPEIMVFGDKFKVVKRRETYKSLISGEVIPEELA